MAASVTFEQEPKNEAGCMLTTRMHPHCTAGKVKRDEVEDRDQEEYYYLDTVPETNTRTFFDTIKVTTTIPPENICEYRYSGRKGSDSLTDYYRSDFRKRLKKEEEEDYNSEQQASFDETITSGSIVLMDIQGVLSLSLKRQPSEEGCGWALGSRRHQGTRHRLNAKHSTRQRVVGILLLRC
uniref:Uncharacterized protein n=1 Tax=Setaria digitata TaxID=48799 RepID=A0A915Q715_9BILA